MAIDPKIGPNTATTTPSHIHAAGISANITVNIVKPPNDVKKSRTGTPLPRQTTTADPPSRLKAS
jgi:hypothetical protein